MRHLGLWGRCVSRLNRLSTPSPHLILLFFAACWSYYVGSCLLGLFGLSGAWTEWSAGDEGGVGLRRGGAGQHAALAGGSAAEASALRRCGPWRAAFWWWRIAAQRLGRHAAVALSAARELAVGLLAALLWDTPAGNGPGIVLGCQAGWFAGSCQGPGVACVTWPTLWALRGTLFWAGRG